MGFMEINLYHHPYATLGHDRAQPGGYPQLWGVDMDEQQETLTNAGLMAFYGRLLN